MPYEREGYAPWSLTREAGVQSATVDGTIKVPQYVQPTLSTGFVDEKGNWQGSKSSDEEFIGITKALAIANTGEVLFPDTNSFPSIDMTGFSDILLGIKPTQSGDYAIRAVMGPDTETFANLSPVVPNALLRGAISAETTPAIVNLLSDNAEALTADAWNIIIIQNSLRGQKNMQIRIQNNTGSEADIEFGFMRLI